MFISAAEAVTLRSLRLSIFAFKAATKPVTLLCAISKSLSFAIEPASCALLIPPDFTVTAPLLTSKSAVAKDAIPLLLDVASSTDTVRVPLVSSYTEVIPSASVKSALTLSSTLSSV